MHPSLLTRELFKVSQSYIKSAKFPRTLMGLKDLFKKGTHEVALLEQHVVHALERVKAEKGLIFSWLHYFKEKDKLHEERYARLQRSEERYQEHIASLREDIFSLKTELHQLRTRQGHVRTQQGTSQGHEKAVAKPKELHEKPLNTSALSGSELEILRLLYHADKPLSYQDIAKQTAKSEKSIRNIIYELRKKGIVIKAVPVGIRQKGFYLDSKTKVLVSGR